MRKRSFSDCDLLFDGAMLHGGLGWREYIKRTGEHTWTVWYDPLDSDDAYLYERSEYDISSLITYVLERDIWLEYDSLGEVPCISLTEQEQEYFEYKHPGGTIGPHMNNLLRHLLKHGNEGELLMVKIAAEITGIAANEVVDSDLINLKILSVSRKAIWKGVYKKAFEISSYFGKGQIYPPGGNGIAPLFLYSGSNPYYYNYQPNYVKLSERAKKELKEVQRKNVKYSLIFHIPHASQDIPNTYMDQFLLRYEELYDEHLRLVDRYADELFDPSGYHSVISPVSRFLCDVERFSNDDEEPMARVGMGAVYLNTTDGKPLRRDLTKKERDHLIEEYHRKNERSVELYQGEAILSNGFALIIDCHTFPSLPLPCDENQAIPRPDICIGTDEDQTSPQVVELVTNYFTELGYSVSMNTPYAGTYIPRKYLLRKKKTDVARESAAKVESIMIEVDRSLYMDEKTGEKLPQFNELQNRLRALWPILEQYIVTRGGIEKRGYREI